MVEEELHGPVRDEKLWVLSLGGSLIFPKQLGKLDVDFLKRFHALIMGAIGDGHRFVIVTGGGALCRIYQGAAKEIVDITSEDLDWIGIHATRINAHLLRTLFRDQAYPRVVKNPTDPITFDEPLLIASGWKPGFSTDFDAVMLAKQLGAKTVINLTNVDRIYDRDPREDDKATPIHEISWQDFLAITGEEWTPGLNVPFDPIASKEAAEQGMRVIITNGHDLDNLLAIISGKPYRGSLIR